MIDQRSMDALARLERALARVEATAEPAGPSDDAGALDELRGAHRRLRTRVEEAIGAIDRLIVVADERRD